MSVLKKLLAKVKVAKHVNHAFVSFFRRGLKASLTIFPPTFFALRSNFNFLEGLKLVVSSPLEQLITFPFTAVFRIPFTLAAIPFFATLAQPLSIIFNESESFSNVFSMLNAASAILLAPLCLLIYQNTQEDNFSVFDGIATQLYRKFFLNLNSSEQAELIQFLKWVHENHSEVMGDDSLDEKAFFKLAASTENFETLTPILIKLLSGYPDLLAQLEMAVAQSGPYPLKDHTTLLWMAAKAASPHLNVSQTEVTLKSDAIINHEKNKHHVSILSDTDTSPHLIGYLNKAKHFAKQ